VGDWRLFFLGRDRVKAVTAEDLARVAKAYFQTNNRSLGLFIPTDKPARVEIPEAGDAAAMVKDYKGQATKSAGEAFDTAPQAIDARTQRFTTAAGLKVAMVPKKTRGGSVTATLSLHFGDEQSLTGKGPNGDLAGGMLIRGTAHHTRQQIADAFDKLKAQVRVSGSAEGARASVETTRENLPEVLKLVVEVLREPSFPESEFETLRQEHLAGTENMRSEPQALASQAFQRHLSAWPKGHPRYVATLDESIAELKAAKVEDAKAFHRAFYGASNGELALVGDFDPKEAQALVSSLVGDWKSPAAYTRIKSVYKDAPALAATLQAPDKPNAFFLGGLNLRLQDTDPEYPAMVLGNFMMGGGFLNSRLATRIRVKEGLSYGVGSQFQAAAADQAGNWMAYAIYAPQNAAKLETAFQEEIAKVLATGFTAEEIKAAKTGWLQSQQMSRAQDRELASRIATSLQWNRTLAFQAELEKQVLALTNEQIQAAFKKHLDPKRLTIVKAGDFNKAVPQK
jgi:zinc protease